VQLKNAYEELNKKDTEVARLKEENHQAIMQGKAVKIVQVVQQGTESKDRLAQKLHEALNKIDEQGKIIDTLAQKLQNSGQSVDVRKLQESFRLCGYTECH
jgi:hypothetical protein